MIVSLAELVACRKDNLGYVTYVFKRLEDITPFTKYVMMVKYPNWETKEIQIGDIGYVEYKEIKAGIDTWFDGEKMNYYLYSTVQFIDFIDKPNKKDNKYIM